MANYPIVEYGFLGKLQVHLVLALVQVGYAFFQLLTKLALEQGLNKTTYPVYRNAIGFAILVPFAAYLERSKRPKLLLNHIVHFFLLGLTAVSLGQGLYLFGLYDTSPTFASVFQNSIPVVTFILAATFRVEDVNLRRRDGQAKLLGALSAGVGAFIMTAYKGPRVLTPAPEVSSYTDLWRLGSLYLVISCLGFGVFYILQARTLKMYPASYTVVCYTNMFGALQLSGFALATQPTLSIWKIRPGVQLLSVLYAGFVASGLVFSAQAWCMQRAGPVIVSAYQPFQTVVVGLISFLFMGESFYLGSVVGAVFIVGGLYLVIWGQELHQQHVLSRQSSLSEQYVEQNKAEENVLDRPLLPNDFCEP